MSVVTVRAPAGALDADGRRTAVRMAEPVTRVVFVHYLDRSAAGGETR